MLGKNNRTISLSIVAAAIIIAGALIYIDQSSSTKDLPMDAAAEKAMAYINENLLGPGMTAFLKEASDEGKVYKVRLEIKEEENVLGEFDSYVSKDGEFMFPEGYNMNEGIVPEEETQGEEAATETQGEELGIPEEELAEFTECLASAGLVVYGANWCGWTGQLVQMLGGWDTVKPIYVECTEEAELCQEKEVAAYPTILINGEPYQGGRTFNDLSVATGCSVPEGGEDKSAGDPSGGC
jgi:hypothetical protein